MNGYIYIYVCVGGSVLVWVKQKEDTVLGAAAAMHSKRAAVERMLGGEGAHHLVLSLDDESAMNICCY
jgi:hypothetical protein